MEIKTNMGHSSMSINTRKVRPCVRGGDAERATVGYHVGIANKFETEAVKTNNVFTWGPRSYNSGNKDLSAPTGGRK